MKPFVLLAAGLVLLFGVPTLPEAVLSWRPWPTVSPAPATASTAAVYVWEKDDHGVPPHVTRAVDRLNRERRVVATIFEADATDGTGDVPEQYRTALDAARKAGLPALVAMAGQTVLRVTPAPASEDAVMEAVP